MLFRNFLGFCHCVKVSVHHLSVDIMIAYLESLAENNVSVNMVANHISALKASFILHGLDHILLDHPKVRYFTKSMRINRPLSLTKRNIMSLNDLKKLALCCNKIPNGQVFKAVFLISFFAFLRISNVAPHARGTFDPTVYLTPSDIVISKKLMKITLKLSKTIQSREKKRMWPWSQDYAPFCALYQLFKKQLLSINPLLMTLSFKYVSTPNGNPSLIHV